MSSRLIADPKTPHGQMLAEAVDFIVKAQDHMRRLRGAVDRMTTGVPADYPAVGTELGMSAADAQELVFLLASADAALNVDIVKEFTQKCDQG